MTDLEIMDLCALLASDTLTDEEREDAQQSLECLMSLKEIEQETEAV